MLVSRPCATILFIQMTLPSYMKFHSYMQSMRQMIEQERNRRGDPITDSNELSRFPCTVLWSARHATMSVSTFFQQPIQSRGWIGPNPSQIRRQSRLVSMGEGQSGESRNKESNPFASRQAVALISASDDLNWKAEYQVKVRLQRRIPLALR